MPVNVQVPLFRTIWKLDRALMKKSPITVAILYQEGYSSSAGVKSSIQNWVDERGQKLRSICVPLDRAEGLAALETVNADVFYIAPLRGVDITAIAKIARGRQIRTITAVPRYVEAGLAVSIDVRDDRPLIVINLEEARAEGSSFPAQLLQLAKIIRNPR